MDSAVQLTSKRKDRFVGFADLERRVNQMAGTAQNDLLRTYIREIRRYRILTRDEQSALAKRYQNHADMEAKEMLVSHNLRLVMAVARRYRGRGMDFLDLIQEGNIGLMKAIDMFDYTKGFALTTYSIWWIRQSITRAIANFASTIRVPVHARELWNKIIASSVDLVALLGREPTEDEVAYRLNLPAPAIAVAMRNMRMTTVSLEDLAQNYDGDPFEMRSTHKHYMQQRIGLRPNQILWAKEELEGCCERIRTLLCALTNFPVRDQIVFRARYGLDETLEPRTLEQVGQGFSVTRERIRQIAAKMWLVLPEHNFWNDEIWLEGEMFRMAELADCKFR